MPYSCWQLGSWAGVRCSLLSTRSLLMLPPPIATIMCISDLMFQRLPTPLGAEDSAAICQTCRDMPCLRSGSEVKDAGAAAAEQLDNHVLFSIYKDLVTKEAGLIASRHKLQEQLAQGVWGYPWIDNSLPASPADADCPYPCACRRPHR
jgi:hypothetical protein